jgi:hypothetical protein
VSIASWAFAPHVLGIERNRGRSLTFGVRIYEQHLPPARILELIAAADSGQ